MTDDAADATIARFLDAGGRLDLPAFLELLAPNVRLRSPISFRARFEGFDEVADLLRIVFDLLDEIEYYESLGSSTARALFFKARIGDDAFDGAIHVLLDERALVAEMTMFVRPLPGLTALTARLTPRLTARRGRVRALALAAMVRPMAVLTSRADGLGVRLMQGRRR